MFGHSVGYYEIVQVFVWERVCVGGLPSAIGVFEQVKGKRVMRWYYNRTG